MNLTPRELEVAKLVAEGLSNPDIAQKLGIGRHTVETHLGNAAKKLGLRNRVLIARWIWEQEPRSTRVPQLCGP